MSEQIKLPALRGVIGDWIYYTALLPIEEVSSRVKRTDEIHNNHGMNDLIQRFLTKRSKEIAAYIQNNEQRFFNSVVIGVYDGQPDWSPISIDDKGSPELKSFNERFLETLGILTLSGNEKLFAIDGQHRVEGIKAYINSLKPEEIATLEDEVCAIFVAHVKSEEGVQRTRRLFSRLNRYAKPVSKLENILLDEDDVIALVTRHLVNEHSLFKNRRVSLDKQKSLNVADFKSITSLVVLYDCMDLYFSDGTPTTWKKFKMKRPDERVIQEYTSKAGCFWDLAVDQIKVFKEIASLATETDLPEGSRGVFGGDLLFRPVAWPLIFHVLKSQKGSGISDEDFWARIDLIPREISSDPWFGLLWNQRMISSSENKKVAQDLLAWMMGFGSQWSEDQKASLLAEWSRVTNSVKTNLPDHLQSSFGK
jgi:DNA sulfur modification protein DndB